MRFADGHRVVREVDIAVIACKVLDQSLDEVEMRFAPGELTENWRQLADVPFADNRQESLHLGILADLFLCTNLNLVARKDEVEVERASMFFGVGAISRITCRLL